MANIHRHGKNYYIIYRLKVLIDMVECIKCSIPPVDKVIASVDLDRAKSVPTTISRADCFVYYQEKGSALIECKTAYIKRAVKQLEECILFLNTNWQEFITSEKLPNSTPFPKNFILFLRNGIGKEKRRYEIDRKSKKLRVRGNGYQMVNNTGYIEVYTEKDLIIMRNNLHTFEVK